MLSRSIIGDKSTSAKRFSLLSIPSEGFELKYPFLDSSDPGYLIACWMGE